MVGAGQCLSLHSFMNIQIVKQKISNKEIIRLAKETYGEMVKGVVDIKQNIMALGGELHADCEAVLLEQGSRPADLWGFNIYPAKNSDDRIEFTSLINIRPAQGNRSIEIQDLSLRKQIRVLIDKLVESYDRF